MGKRKEGRGFLGNLPYLQPPSRSSPVKQRRGGAGRRRRSAAALRGMAAARRRGEKGEGDEGK